MTGHAEEEHRPYEKRIPSTEAERIAIVAAKLALTDGMSEMWAAFGVDRSNVASVESFKRDLMFVRDLRNASEKAKSRMWLTIWTMIVAAGAIGLWQWFKDAVRVAH